MPEELDTAALQAEVDRLKALAIRSNDTDDVPQSFTRQLKAFDVEMISFYTPHACQALVISICCVANTGCCRRWDPRDIDAFGLPPGTSIEVRTLNYSNGDVYEVSTMQDDVRWFPRPPSCVCSHPTTLANISSGCRSSWLAVLP